MKDIGQLKVLLIRTGVEQGLSASISFHPIAHEITGFSQGSIGGKTAAIVETTLKTAVKFIMDLEERETVAFGLRPDPVASTKYRERFEDGYLTSLEAGEWAIPASEQEGKVRQARSWFECPPTSAALLRTERPP